MANYKNWGYIRMNVLKFLLLYIIIIINFFFTKITNFSYNFTGLLLSTVNKKTLLRIIKIPKVNFTSLIQMQAKSSCLILNKLFTKYQDNTHVIHLRSDFFLILSTFYHLHV